MAWKENIAFSLQTCKDFFRRIYDSNVNYELFCLYLAGSLPHSQTRVTGAAATADRARGGEGDREGNGETDNLIN